MHNVVSLLRAISEMTDLNIALQDATMTLSKSSTTARLDAEILMAHALGLERSNMLLRRNDLSVPDNFALLLERRALSEPIAYIIGHQDFWDLTLHVTPDVLIPRPDSETIIDWLEDLYKDNPPQTILDLGTGSGALLLAALSLFPDAKGFGIDNSAAAIEIAMRNAEHNDLADRSKFICADWTQAGWSDLLPKPFDLIISNPPYIADHEQLMADVVKFEPASALFAGDDGLDDYKILIPQLHNLMSADSKILLEIGCRQARCVSVIAEELGYLTFVKQDLAGLDRVVSLEQNRA